MAEVMIFVMVNILTWNESLLLKDFLSKVKILSFKLYKEQVTYTVM